MTFRDLLDSDQLLLVVCNDCHCRTPVDPSPHALRLGVASDAALLRHGMTCPVCGTADIALAAFSPLADRRLTQLA